MLRAFILALLLFVAVPANARDLNSMQFRWIPPASFEISGDIVAVGPITADTPRAFDEFVRRHEIRQATVHLSSPGGSVAGAIAFGRLIRSFGFGTQPNGLPSTEALFAAPSPTLEMASPDCNPADSTRPLPRSAVPGLCSDGGAVFTFPGSYVDARCDSACVLAFLGGESRELARFRDRHIGGQNQLGFHQFAPDPIDGVPPAGAAQLLGASIDKYLADMGIGREIFDFANRAPLLHSAQRPLYYPPVADLVRAAVVTTGGVSALRLAPDGEGLVLVARGTDYHAAPFQLTLGCFRFGDIQPAALRLIITQFYRDSANLAHRSISFAPAPSEQNQGTIVLAQVTQGMTPQAFGLRLSDGRGERKEVAGTVIFGISAQTPATQLMSHSVYDLDGPLAAWLSAAGDRIEITYGAQIQYVDSLALAAVSEVRFGRALPLLMRNCVNTSTPVALESRIRAGG